MKNSIEQLSVPALIVNHFYVGVIITLFYVCISPFIIEAGLPGLSVLLIAEVVILVPLVWGHLYRRSRVFALSSETLIPYQKKLSVKTFVIWSLAGMFACVAVYVPLYPLGLLLKESWFGWLPEWYFNPSFGTSNAQLIANTFLVAILIDGLVGPIAEELFFRGYLLPRMTFLRSMAPVVNGALFGMYHFWQPHNIIATMAIGIVLSFVVWKTKNVYIAIVIHCVLNVLGALGGYLAASNGTVIVR